MSSSDSMRLCALDADGPIPALVSVPVITAVTHPDSVADAAEPTDSASKSASQYGCRDSCPVLDEMSELVAAALQALMGTPKPTLTNELIELVACFVLRMLPDKFYLPTDPAVSQPLNILSRAVMPAPTKIVLMLLPTVTLNSAASCAGGDVAQLLSVMVDLSAEPYHRPLAYNGGSFVSEAAETGALAVLQWWHGHKDSVPLLCDTDGVIDIALRHGQAHILDWCVEVGLRLPTEDLCTIWCSSNLAVLDWCLAHGLPLDYDEDTMDDASECGQVHVLDWWKSSGLPLKYSHHALAQAILTEQHAVLDWWGDSGLRLYGDDLELTRHAIQAADMYALKWLARHNLLLVHPSLLEYLFSVRDVDVIQWCMDRFKLLPSALGLVTEVWVGASNQESPLALELAQMLGFQEPTASSVPGCLEEAAKWGRIALLDWWLWTIPNLTADQFQPALIAATSAGHVLVLDWIKRHGYFNQDKGPDIPALTLAAKRGHLDVIDWFARHPRCGCGTRSHHEFPSLVFLAAVEHGRVNIVNWWRKNTLSVPSFAHPGTSGRQAFITAARAGNGEVLKSWVDAKMHLSDDVTELASSFVCEVMSLLLRSPKSSSISYLKWWVTLTGCRSHAWCVDIVREACSLNRVDVLDWMLESQLLDPEHLYGGPRFASQEGHIQALDWWAAHSNVVKASFDPIACFGFDAPAAHRACRWWAHNSSPLSLQACELPLRLIGVEGAVALMDCMVRLGVFTLPMTYWVYDVASEEGSVDVLTWWYTTNMVPKKAKKYSKDALLTASVRSHIYVLDWWKLMSVDGPSTRAAGPLKLKLPFRSLNAMMDRGNIDPLAVEWWIRSGLLPETAPLEGEQDDDDEDEDQDEDGDDEEDEGENGDENGEGDQDGNPGDPMAVGDIPL